MKGQKSASFYPVDPPDEQPDLLGHELCNVLNGLLGMAELLGESGLNDEQSQWVKAIEHSSLQMQALIEPERFSGQGPGVNLTPRPRQVDGVQLLEQVLTSHKPAAQSRTNQLFMMMDPELPRYWNCDPCMVRQLLDNVLGNAIKFTQAGQVLVEVLAGSDKRMLVFRISDTGPGIRKTREEPECAGESRRSVKDAVRHDGQGLGLYICRQIVSALTGRLSCTSPGSGGTCIEISLPEVLAASASHARPGCALFAAIRCRLTLAEPLLKCTVSILDRLGVEWTCDAPEYSDQCFYVEVSEAFPGSNPGGGSLLLSPVPVNGSACGPKAVTLPLLESSVGSLLLEMAFEWHGRNIRCDIPGSAPARR